ncbi:hypothetical protein FHL15_010570 [Xylaria flabelliformis]|uniref:G domain-containing protein n=1 Tax=Xylaria flabelliformis TaxID=2512241 RepID=A0A553HKQ4_9PEZI|nr:hypothetical protein FHL15_010570 [Xylaria flabelliformis]
MSKQEDSTGQKDPPRDTEEGHPVDDAHPPSQEQSHSTTKKIRILIMGPIGSGKSSFVKAAREPGHDDVEISSKVDSCTHECTEYETKYSSGRNKIFLIDTPGFEDPQTPNANTLEKIAKQINEGAQCDSSGCDKASSISEPISGLIYLHRCTDTRFDGDLKVNFEIIKAMCGPEFYSRVVICSTFWNHTLKDRLQQHKTRMERFLEHFEEVMKGGAEYREFWKDEEDPCSDILNHFLSQRNHPKMAIEHEFQKRKLNETKAGHVAGDRVRQAESWWSSILRMIPRPHPI